MEHLRYAMKVFSRVLDVFVITPAACTFILALFVYHFSFYAMVHDAYEFAETIARTSEKSPSGYLKIKQCIKDQQQQLSPPALVAPCTNFTEEEISIDDLSRSGASAISSIYWIFVMFGLLIKILVMGPKSFFMLDGVSQEEATFSDKTTKS